MTAKQVNQFINELWKRIIKPTWDKPLNEINFEWLVNEAADLDDKYSDNEMAARMINAYMIALEHKEDKA